MFLPLRHKTTFAIIFVALFFLSFAFYTAHSPRTYSFLTGQGFPNSETTFSLEVNQPICRHVAVASYVGWHFEISMSMVSVLEKELCPYPTGGVRVYIPHPFGQGFDSLADELNLYHGEFFDHKEALFEDLDSTTLFPGDKGSMIDTVILPSCEWE
jgi:hypothetical protein